VASLLPFCRALAAGRDEEATRHAGALVSAWLKPFAPLLLPFVTHAAFAQLVRFALGGLACTLFATCVYIAAAVGFGIAALSANTISHGFGIFASYMVHSRWSFAAGGKGEEAAMIARFVAVSGFAYALNSFWVWVAVHALDLSPLAPVPAMIFITPVASFLLNRYWVFRVAAR
jgi:putative flippase GtrA